MPSDVFVFLVLVISFGDCDDTINTSTGILFFVWIYSTVTV